MIRKGIPGWLLVLLGLLMVLLPACDGSVATTASETKDAVEELIAEDETAIIVTSTPSPTHEPGVVDEAVSAVAETTNLDQFSLLGLTGEDWINILVSAAVVLLGYFIASWVVRVLLSWLVRRTKTDFDDLFLERIDGPVRYFVLVIFLQFSVLRLTIWGETALRLLNNLFFFLYFGILFWIAWRLVGFSLDWYRLHMEQETEEQTERVNRTLPLVSRFLYLALIFIASFVILTHFNVNMTALLAALGLAGLAVTLAAQDTLTDIINGMLIWVDQPFRIGDRIEIQGENTWGDVVNIGTRTTRILSRDNSMVIVPNSVIGKNQVINYTFPDPSVRVEIKLNLDYAVDLDKARRVVRDAVRQVDHVEPDQPIDVLFLDFGTSTLEFRIRYWIDSYADTFLMRDKVNNGIIEALRAANIKIPFPKQDLNLRVEGGDSSQLSPTVEEDHK